MTSILVLALILAQQITPLPEKCTLSGTVVDSVTGVPLSKVDVTAENSGDRVGGFSTITDAQGNFLIIDVEPGQYRLAARRNGYLDTYFGAKRASGSGTAVTLTAGQKMEDLRIKLMPYGVIAGTVRDTDGEPLVGASVNVYRLVGRTGETRMQQVTYKRTDDLGAYRVADLKPGKYYVYAQWDSGGRPLAVDHSVRTTGPPEVPIATFFPGTTDPTAARAVEVDIGSRLAGIDIPIIRSRTYKLRVHVESAPGLRRGLTLRYPIDGLPWVVINQSVFQTDANGDVEIPGVPPGSYKMQAWAGEPDKPGCGTSVPISVDRHDVEGIRVAVAVNGCAPAVAEGHVTVEGSDKPAPGSGVVHFEQPEQMDVPLRPDGSFTITLLPGVLDIDLSRITAEKGLYVKSIRSGDQDVLHNGLTSAPSQHLDLQIVLASDGGRVEGAVSDADDKPAIGATVVLIPTDPILRARFDFTKDVATDQSGHFELKNVAPGEYRLFAWDDIEPRSWFDPDVLRNVEAKGEPVTVKPKDPAAVKLHLIQ